MNVEHGSIEGTLVVGRRTWLQDELGLWAARCRGISEDAATHNLQRVSVTGQITTDDLGNPVSIEVEKIEQLPDESECPQMEDLQAMDIDITGGVDSAAHVRRLREES